MLKPKICSIYHWTIKWSLAAQNCQNIFSGRFLVVRSLRDSKITFLKSSHFDSKRKKFQLNQAHPWGIKKSFFCRSRFFAFFAFSTFLYFINVALCLSRLSRDKFYITGSKYITKFEKFEKQRGSWFWDFLFVYPVECCLMWPRIILSCWLIGSNSSRLTSPKLLFYT